jgi:hypothetical protein
MKPIFLAPLIAVVLAATGAGAYFAVAGAGSGEEAPAAHATATPTATPAPSQEPTPTPAPAETSPPAETPTPTPAPTGWLTYTDATYGYSFEYPRDWFVHTDAVGGAIVSSWDTTQAKGIGAPLGDQFKIDIVVIDNSEGLTLADWIVKYATSSTDPPTVLSQSPVVLDGIPGVKRETVAQDTHASQHFFLVGTKVYSLTALPLDSPLADTGFRIVASFKFSQ